MNIFTERQIGYLAGIIDGEGSITIHTRKPLPSNSYRLYYRPIIGVYNTDFRLVEYIKHICGVGWAGLSSKNGGVRNPLYQFQLGQKIEIHPFLKQIKDALCIKKEQAELMIRFIESRGLEPFYSCKKGMKRGTVKQPYTQEELNIVEQLHQLHMKIKINTKKMSPVFSTINQEYIQTVNSLPSIG